MQIWKFIDNLSLGLCTFYFPSTPNLSYLWLFAANREARGIYYACFTFTSLFHQSSLGFSWLKWKYYTLLSIVFVASIGNIYETLLKPLNHIRRKSWQSLVSESVAETGTWWIGMGNGEWFGFGMYFYFININSLQKFTIVGHNGLNASHCIIPSVFLKEMFVDKYPFTESMRNLNTDFPKENEKESKDPSEELDDSDQSEIEEIETENVLEGSWIQELDSE